MDKQYRRIVPLTFIMHSATIKYFNTLELIHFQIKIPKGGKPKPRRGECSPLKETLLVTLYMHYTVRGCLSSEGQKLDFYFSIKLMFISFGVTAKSS